MKVDIHTHVFPDKICERTIKILEDNIFTYSHQHYYAKGDASINGLYSSMKDAGLDYSVVMPIATAPKQTHNINTFAKEINGKNGVLSFGSLHPSQENYEQILEEIAEAGLLGIKLHPEYQQLFIDSPEAIRILKKCEQLGLYTMLHAGKDHGCPPPVHCSPERLSHVLDYVSGNYIIAAHMGGWSMWDDVDKYILSTPILIDTCFSLHLMSSGDVSSMIKKHGSDKVLMGSDWPWYSQKENLLLTQKLSLPEADIAKITGGNAARILRLK